MWTIAMKQTWQKTTYSKHKIYVIRNGDLGKSLMCLNLNPSLRWGSISPAGWKTASCSALMGDNKESFTHGYTIELP